MGLGLRYATALGRGVSVIALMTAASMQSALGQGAEPLPEIRITADNVEGTTYDSPGTVTVKTDREIDRQNINSARDFVRDEPGISVGNQPSRGGMTNFVIRGVGENRVRLEIDGVKVPDFPGTNTGSPTGYTRDFIDYDSLKRVEIIRGPASALYGSDALGGVVSFITKDPRDYLAMVNKDWFFSQKGGADTTDRSYTSTSTAAYRHGRWESMMLYTHRIGHEVTPNSFLWANPQNWYSDNILAKVVYNHDSLGEFKFTGEYLRKKTYTDVNTEEQRIPFLAHVFASEAVDTNERPRVSLDWNAPVNAWWADTSQFKLYWTQQARREVQNQSRDSTTLGTVPNIIRYSDFRFYQNIFGSTLQLDARREFWNWSHHMTYGGQVDTTDTTRPRARYEQFINGPIRFNVAGESYPNKNFPDTITTNASFYWQDIMQQGAWRLIPAIRYDFFQMTPHQDADFRRSNFGNFAVSSQTEHGISPKIGTTYDLTENYRVFAQYARGFRAPPYDNANFGFRNTTSFYEILPNPDLKPETSDGYEGGIRGRFSGGSFFELTAFWNNYRDFIDTVTLVDNTNNIPALTQFQYRNVSSVTIRGFEGKGEWRFHPIWSVFGSFAYAYGINNETNQPIDSVDPFTAVGGLRFRENGWIGEGRVRYYASKNRVSLPTLFTVPEHTVVDALLSYEVYPQFTFSMGVYNIFDLSYWDPQSVAGVTIRPTGAGAIGFVPMELYRAPGRTLAANLVYRW